MPDQRGGASQPDEFLTVSEVAALLKLNQQTVRNWIDSGFLPAVRIGRRVRIKRAQTSTECGGRLGYIATRRQRRRQAFGRAISHYQRAPEPMSPTEVADATRRSRVTVYKWAPRIEA